MQFQRNCFMMKVLQAKAHFSFIGKHNKINELSESARGKTTCFRLVLMKTRPIEFCFCNCNVAVVCCTDGSLVVLTQFPSYVSSKIICRRMRRKSVVVADPVFILWFQLTTRSQMCWSFDDDIAFQFSSPSNSQGNSLCMWLFVVFTNDTLTFVLAKLFPKILLDTRGNFPFGSVLVP